MSLYTFCAFFLVSLKYKTYNEKGLCKCWNYLLEVALQLLPGDGFDLLSEIKQVVRGSDLKSAKE